jgi:DNA-binding response OmpR family regulator/two-component sensor histidine kinase
MSHELRTPLNAIIGFSELLSDSRYGDLTERQKRYVDHVRTAGQHLLRLINDILDLSKIEAGRMELATANVTLEPILQEVRETVAPLVEKKSQSLTQLTEPGLSVVADPIRLKQVLMNLVGNAIKFTPEGGKIEIKTRLADGRARLEVQDNGPGIPLDAQKQLFEAFQRLRHPSQNSEGTGLGLAISKRLIELQGGEIGLESEPGQGSCFFFTLPSATPMPEVVARTLPDVAMKEIPVVLVIEDDPAAARLIQSQLTTSGYRSVVCAQPHDDPMEMVEAVNPHAITLDLMMKPTSGWDVLFQLKMNPKTKSIPVIVVSVLDQPARGAAFVADEYLVKPVEKATLLSAVERCLRKRNATNSRTPILVVEDNTGARELVAQTLSAQGYTVVTAVDGLQARVYVENALPQLVILDLMLPESSGFQLLMEWRANERTAQLPVMVLTGKELTKDEMAYLQENTKAVLSKESRWQDDLTEQLGRLSPHEQ